MLNVNRKAKNVICLKITSLLRSLSGNGVLHHISKIMRAVDIILNIIYLGQYRVTVTVLPAKVNL